jgi:hypothetical protein
LIGHGAYSSSAVILSAAKDLVPVAGGDEVLSFGFAQDRRFAQD